MCDPSWTKCTGSAGTPLRHEDQSTLEHAQGRKVPRANGPLYRVFAAAAGGAVALTVNACAAVEAVRRWLNTCASLQGAGELDRWSDSSRDSLTFHRRIKRQWSDVGSLYGKN